MKAATLLLPLIGAALGAFGYFSEISWLFYTGAALCGLNEFLNVASGTYKAPVIAIILSAAGAAIVSPWYAGILLALCAAGALDGIGEIYGRLVARKMNTAETR